MFPLSLLRSPHSPLCVCTEPALTLWPATRLIFGQLEDDMLSMRSEMERRMQRVNQAYQLLSQDADTRSRIAQSRQSAAKESEKLRPKTDEAGKDHFELSLDVSRFSPEELTVKTEGRRLIVMGKHEEKRDAEDGSRFHEYREWRREAELPEDVNPEEVMSSLSQDGKLLIQAPRLALPAAAAERTTSITTTQTPVNGEGKSAEPRNSSEKEQPETGAHSSS
ncbi:heat shock protein 30C-like [Spea bombifrons]|uniref:heat shock protein 30C-like n=1 Tax=Spea bombifrons TaxID=233779 RepID=UPI00234AD19D|nr:heat shock protein 30C-like [Spea bombifrons]